MWIARARPASASQAALRSSRGSFSRFNVSGSRAAPRSFSEQCVSSPGTTGAPGGGSPTSGLVTGLTTVPPGGPAAARPGLTGRSPSSTVTSAPRGDGRPQRERPACHVALGAVACGPVRVTASSTSTGRASRPGLPTWGSGGTSLGVSRYPLSCASGSSPPARSPRCPQVVTRWRSRDDPPILLGASMREYPASGRPTSSLAVSGLHSGSAAIAPVGDQPRPRPP